MSDVHPFRVDIIERLNEGFSAKQLYIVPRDCPLIAEAIAEIKRLRSELHQAREDFSRSMGGSYSE